MPDRLNPETVFLALMSLRGRLDDEEYDAASRQLLDDGGYGEGLTEAEVGELLEGL